MLPRAPRSTLFPYTTLFRSGQTNVHCFAYALSDENTLHVADAFPLRLGAHGLERFNDAERGRVAVLAVPHGPRHHLNQVRRRVEIVRQRVADIERKDFFARASQPLGHHGDVADGVAHALQTRGGKNLPNVGNLVRHPDTRFLTERRMPVNRSSTQMRATRQVNQPFFRSSSMTALFAASIADPML